MMIALVFLAILVLSIAVYAAAMRTVEMLRRDRPEARLSGFAPPVSIIKPLSGRDDELEANLESFYRLEYPQYEVIFSCAHRTDPAFAIARRVADRYPGVPTIFALDAREPGGNSKINRLVAGLRHARFPYVLMSDGNVRVHPEFLLRAITEFEQRSVGLVSHLFLARGARTLGSSLESLYLNSTLRAGTAVLARVFRMPCVVGKSILISREALNAIGGIETLRDHLAEDYLLGKLVAGAGYRVVLSADEIETREVSRSIASAWNRQRRWAILRKRLAGASYASELLASPLPWFVGVELASRGHGRVAILAALLYLLRMALEVRSAARAGLSLTLAQWLLLPVRDAAVAALFWAGLFGLRTTWRGRSLFVGRQTLIGKRGRLATVMMGIITFCLIGLG